MDLVPIYLAVSSHFCSLTLSLCGAHPRGSMLVFFFAYSIFLNSSSSFSFYARECHGPTGPLFFAPSIERERERERSGHSVVYPSTFLISFFFLVFSLSSAHGRFALWASREEDSRVFYEPNDGMRAKDRERGTKQKKKTQCYFSSLLGFYYRLVKYPRYKNSSVENNVMRIYTRTLGNTYIYIYIEGFRRLHWSSTIMDESNID